MNFDAPWDNVLKFATTLVIALFVWIAWMPPYEPEWIVLLKVVLPLAILGVSWALAPAGYRLEGDELIVKRNLGETRIPLRGLKDARPLSRSEVRGTIRTFGVGGLFGYYGKFYSFSLGSQTWYVTDRSRIVLLETATRKYLVSPDNPEALISSIKALR